MGLDTSHDAWHGAYSAFGRWRHEIAVAAGIIKEDESLFPKGDWDTSDLKESPLDWETLDSMTDCYGIWHKEPEDPIWYLLNHSDCEGVIQHQHCLPLAMRLKELVSAVDKKDYHYTEWQESKTQRFVEGLLAAHHAGEDVDFH